MVELIGLVSDLPHGTSSSPNWNLLESHYNMSAVNICEGEINLGSLMNKGLHGKIG